MDKQRVVYAARHQERLLSGRFRTPRKPSTFPGVESTTRCILGESSAPAQWPDCCRLVENIFIRLCNLHRRPVRRGRTADSRWSLILRDYHKIRQLVIGNSLVMQGTAIQLVEVNQNTLIQWHNKRQKRQELSVLLQGTEALPPALPLSNEPLLDARVLPAVLTPAREEHQYRLPESTAGQAQQRQAVWSQRPRSIMPKVVCHTLSTRTLSNPLPSDPQSSRTNFKCFDCRPSCACSSATKQRSYKHSGSWSCAEETIQADSRGKHLQEVWSVPHC